jgi:hypothetical protein
MPFDSVLRDREGEPARRKAWMRDQYQHPEEHRHTLAEVQGWFAENGVEYLRTYPSAMLCQDSEKLFTLPKTAGTLKAGGTAWMDWCSSARGWPFRYRRSAHLTGGAVPQDIRLRSRLSKLLVHLFVRPPEVK